MKRSVKWLGAAAFLTLVTADAQAQNVRRGGGLPARGEQDAQGRGVPPAQRIRQILRNQLQLDEQQITRLQQTTTRFAERRRGLMAEERQTRVGMRDLLCSTDTTRGAEVARSLDQLSDIQKRRMQLFDEEQKELATFLNPYQRAKYIGAQERILGVLQGSDGGGRGGGRGRMGPPPGGPPPGGAIQGGERGARRQGQGPPPAEGMRGDGLPVPPGCGDPPPGPAR